MWASRIGFLNAHIFCKLYNLLLLFDMAIPNCCEILPHHGVQRFLVDTVGATIAFPVPVIAPAHIFHPLVSTPVSNHRNERVPALLTGKQSGIAVLGLVPIGWTGLLFHSPLNCLPLLPGDNDGEEALMPVPLTWGQPFYFSTVGLRAVVHQRAGIGLLHQYIFDTGISPEIFPVLGFVCGPHLPATVLGTELRRSFTPQFIELPGDLFLPTSLQIQGIDDPHCLRRLRPGP